MADKKVTRRLSIFINDKEVVNSLSGIGRAIGATKKEMNNLNRESETYEEDLAKLQKRLEQLNDVYEESKEEIHGNSKAYESASGAVKNFFGALMSGDIKGAAAELGSLRGSIQGLTKSAMAFIATPIGIAITALAGIAVATREWIKYNNAVAEANKQVRGLTGVSDEIVDSLRIKATSMSKMFDVSMEETLGAAKVLVNEFGISYSEALNQIEEDLIKGAAFNNEYFDSLKEYPTFFANAGYSVEEFRSIVNAGFDLGIYTDKLPDAIKEFGLSMEEQTTATRDALVNAFGEDFTNRLFKGIKDGSISVKDSLKIISEEAERLGLNVQQAQQLTADLFRGAGEDAGGALKIFEAINQAYSDQNRELTEIEKSVKELSDSHERLAKAQDLALKSDGFEVWKNSAMTALNDIKAGFYQFLAVLLNTDEQLNKMRLDERIRQNVEDEVNQFDQYIESIKSKLGERFDFEEQKERYIATLREHMASARARKSEDEVKILEASIQHIQTLQQKVAKTNPFGSQQEDAEAKKRADALKKQREKEQREREKAEREAARLAEQTAKQLVDAKIRLAKAELNHFLITETSKLDGVKRLTEELVKEEIVRLEKINNVKLKDLEAERLRQIEEAKSKVLSEEEMTAQLLAIDLEYETAKQQLELGLQQETHRLKEEFETQKKAEAAERLKIENELALAEAENTWEEQKIKEEQRLQEELQRYRDLLEAKKISKEEFDKFVEATTQKSAEVQSQIELNKTATILGALGQLTGALSEVFGQSKELAKAQALINGATAITQIWASQATGVLWIDVALKAAQSIAVAATTAAQIKEINKQKAPKKAKFFYGGATGTAPMLGYDEYGPVTGVVHKNEYVIPESMTQDPRYANTISWLEAERQGKIKRFNQGGFTSTPAPEFSHNPTNSDSSSVAMYEVMDRLATVLEGGIKAHTFIGYEEQMKLNDLNKDIDNSSTNGLL